MSGILFLLSDFGTCDGYTAQMKGAVLSFCGEGVTMIDLTHSVNPGSVHQGAYHLMTSVPRLPDGSVILAVVDPGVGTGRRGLACRLGERIVVGPDNGLLSWLDADEVRILPPPGPGASTTFHGRDWFAPMAARFLVNPGWLSFLEPCADPVTLPRGETLRSGGTVTTTVAHVDHFGNCVLWASPEHLLGFRPGFVSVRHDRFPTVFTSTYRNDAPGASILLVPGSQGLLELAAPGGSARELLGISTGDTVLIEEGS
ncbi:MAG: SAM-dependent chlorinase/fluorinase [Candidatus Fermentibacteraceae bacterium]